MPKIKGSDLVLTRREDRFYQLWLTGHFNQTDSARQAGYSEKSAEQMGRRLVKFLNAHPQILASDAFNKVGATVPAAARRIHLAMSREESGCDKTALIAARTVLAVHGVGSSASDPTKSPINISGDKVMIVIKGEDSRIKQLTGGNCGAGQE